METKRCSCCNEVKPVSEFHKRKAKKDGLQYECKSCVKAYYETNKDKIKAYYETNKDKIKAYREANKEERIHNGIKKRAKKKGIEFDLTVEDVSNYDTCPVFGWKLERGSRGVPQKISPSVDRIDPKKGYTKDNIQIISNMANTMKQDATPEELLMFADWIIKTYRK